MKIDDNQFQERLNNALSHYRKTIEEIDSLLQRRIGCQDIILLSCARLDSLANQAYYNSSSQHSAFTGFVSQYSGQKKMFAEISVGDLYWFLSYYGFIADGGLIEVPGRVRRFGPDSERFLIFLEQTAIPLTSESVQLMLQKVCTILERYYRVKPRQRRSKPYAASSTSVINTIGRELKHPQREQIIEALGKIIEDFSLRSILYRQYRNTSIHGLRVGLNEEDFFDNYAPFYAEVIHHDLTVFQISFPGPFLRDLLSNCLRTYTNHMANKKKLPLDLFNEMFSIDEALENDALDFLDDDALYEFENVRWQLKNR